MYLVSATKKNHLMPFMKIIAVCEILGAHSDVV